MPIDVVVQASAVVPIAVLLTRQRGNPANTPDNLELLFEPGNRQEIAALHVRPLLRVGGLVAGQEVERRERAVV